LQLGPQVHAAPVSQLHLPASFSATPPQQEPSDFFEAQVAHLQLGPQVQAAPLSQLQTPAFFSATLLQHEAVDLPPPHDGQSAQTPVGPQIQAASEQQEAAFVEEAATDILG
jgi:hypothetical protein